MRFPRTSTLDMLIGVVRIFGGQAKSSKLSTDRKMSLHAPAFRSIGLMALSLSFSIFFTACASGPTPLPAPVVPEMEPEGPVAAEPAKPQFKQLSAEEDFQAQKLWIWVENQRKMGRLPIVNYGQMVKTCRDIIQRWPESKYAFFAKRALGDLPERYHRMYNITKEEIDLGNLK